MVERKVLLVDTDEDFTMSMRRRLFTRGISVSSASSAEQALRCLDATPDMDAVLLDVLLPGMEDFTTLREIQTLYPTVRIVVLTKRNTLESAIECMRLGAFDYSIKPCELDDLVAKVEQAGKEKREHQNKILVAGARVLRQKWLDEE